MVLHLFFSIIGTAFFLLTVYVGVHVSYAQVMQSGSYQIQSDSLNVGGGYATSASYISESTTGEIATGESNSGSYGVRAGYQQMAAAYIALSGLSDVTLLPSIGGVSGGQSSGTSTLTVITDSSGGYQLTIQAANNPAMQSPTDSIDDYTPAGAVPDFTFNYGAGEAVFGYSPEGVDVTQRFLDNGTDTCGVDSNESASRCWDGLSTSAVAIAEGSTANHPAGATTSILFRVGVGGAVGKPVGTYIATTTITALPL